MKRKTVKKVRCLGIKSCRPAEVVTNRKCRYKGERLGEKFRVSNAQKYLNLIIHFIDEQVFICLIFAFLYPFHLKMW